LVPAWCCAYLRTRLLSSYAPYLGKGFVDARFAFVGTTLKRDGVTWNPVDRDRTLRFMDAARAARERVAVS